MFHLRDDFLILFLTTQPNKKNHKCSSLVFIARPDAKYAPVLKSIFIFRTLTPSAYTKQYFSHFLLIFTRYRTTTQYLLPVNLICAHTNKQKVETFVWKMGRREEQLSPQYFIQQKLFCFNFSYHMLRKIFAFHFSDCHCSFQHKYQG